MAVNNDVNKLLKRHEAKLKQKINRAKAERRGRAGRPDQKGGAWKSNKATGGKMAK
jgi:hypothetical protein